MRPADPDEERQEEPPEDAGAVVVDLSMVATSRTRHEHHQDSWETQSYDGPYRFGGASPPDDDTRSVRMGGRWDARRRRGARKRTYAQRTETDAPDVGAQGAQCVPSVALPPSKRATEPHDELRRSHAIAPCDDPPTTEVLCPSGNQI